MGREINVKLGSVALKNFPRVNDTSTERSFDISLSECAALAKPEIAFRDKYVSAQQADPTILSLKSGGAAGFGIVVKNGLDQQRIRFDGTPYPMRRVGDSADLPLSAAYIRIGAEGELKAGVADGAAEFTLPSLSGAAVLSRRFPPRLGKRRRLSRQPSRRLGPHLQWLQIAEGALHIAPLLVLGLVRTCHSARGIPILRMGEGFLRDMQVSSVGFRANKRTLFSRR